jgi:Ca2+:H+ antiporter
MNRPHERQGPCLAPEWPLIVGLGTGALFFVFGSGWLAGLANPAWLAFLFVWLFAVMMLLATAVVRHAESLAARFGEPLGTLVLTLSVTGIEVMMISSVMYTGQGHPALARDAVFAAVMILLNCMVGVSLLLGGLRYREQTYNLQAVNAFLAVIVPLVVFALVLPNYTVSVAGPKFSPFQSEFDIGMSLALYGVFLAIQNVRHREYFVEPAAGATTGSPGAPVAVGHEVRSPAYHFPLLLAYLVLIAYLSGRIAVPIDYSIDVLKLPAALGGLFVSVLVLSSESLSAARAALANQLQRSVNLLLGSALATISLTIPAVLAIGLVRGQTIELGLGPVDTILLLLTLAVSTLTFASGRTNVLLGAVHVLLFLAYLMLIFEQ